MKMFIILESLAFIFVVYRGSLPDPAESKLNYTLEVSWRSIILSEISYIRNVVFHPL